MGSKPAEQCFWYRSAPWNQLLNSFLSSSFNRSWPSGHRNRVEICCCAGSKPAVGSKPTELTQQSGNLLFRRFKTCCGFKTCHRLKTYQMSQQSWNLWAKNLLRVRNLPSAQNLSNVTTELKSVGSKPAEWQFFVIGTHSDFDLWIVPSALHSTVLSRAVIASE